MIQGTVRKLVRVIMGSMPQDDSSSSIYSIQKRVGGKSARLICKNCK